MKSATLAVALVASLVFAPSPAIAGSSMVGLINGSRSTPLVSNPTLASAAAAHAARMAERGEIFHSSNLAEITTGWQEMGENVGVGASSEAVFDAFMASPGHRANILGDFTHVGVGTFTDADGLVWVTVIFMRTDDAGVSAASEPSPRVAPSGPMQPPSPSPSPRIRSRGTPTPSRFGSDATHPFAV